MGESKKARSTNISSVHQIENGVFAPVDTRELISSIESFNVVD